MDRDRISRLKSRERIETGSPGVDYRAEKRISRLKSRERIETVPSRAVITSVSQYLPAKKPGAD